MSSYKKKVTIIQNKMYHMKRISFENMNLTSRIKAIVLEVDNNQPSQVKRIHIMSRDDKNLCFSREFLQSNILTFPKKEKKTLGKVTFESPTTKTICAILNELSQIESISQDTINEIWSSINYRRVSNQNVGEKNSISVNPEYATVTKNPKKNDTVIQISESQITNQKDHSRSSYWERATPFLIAETISLSLFALNFYDVLYAPCPFPELLLSTALTSELMMIYQACRSYRGNQQADDHTSVYEKISFSQTTKTPEPLRKTRPCELFKPVRPSNGTPSCTGKRRDNPTYQTSFQVT